MRLNVLVHSCIYYRYDTSIISDYEFDKRCKELVKLQEKHPEVAKRVCYHDAFKDFDGTTGFDLPLGKSWVRSKAEYLIEHFKDET